MCVAAFVGELRVRVGLVTDGRCMDGEREWLVGDTRRALLERDILRWCLWTGDCRKCLDWLRETDGETVGETETAPAGVEDTAEEEDEEEEVVVSR